MNAIVAPSCPICGGELLPILWGMPSSEDVEAGERGEVYIGGCVLPSHAQPRWQCTACRRDVAEEPRDA